MKVHSIKQNKTQSPRFCAVKVAQIKPKAALAEDVFIYALDRDKDWDYCWDLSHKLMHSSPKRMNTEKSTIFQFLYSAFSSVVYSDRAFLAAKGRTPFGLMSIMDVNPKESHLSYLATWKTPDLKKIKNGGSMLINHLLKENKDKNKITLTPAFNSDLFYYKFGFDYDEYPMTTMFIDNKDILPELKKLSDKFTYKEIENTKPVNLENVLDCG